MEIYLYEGGGGEILLLVHRFEGDSVGFHERGREERDELPPLCFVRVGVDRKMVGCG